MLNQFFSRVGSNRQYLLFALWLLIIVTFSSVIGADYVYFDEHVEVLGNPLITAPLAADSLLRIFSSFQANQYTPLSLASFWLEYNLFGFNSAVSHLINLFLHLLCATLVFFVAEFFLGKGLPAFFAAALWALHPLQVETVAWVLERRNLLYGTFYFASLLAYIHFLQTQKQKYIAVATVLMVLSGLAKTLAFFLPVNWLLIDWLKTRSFSLKLVGEKAAALIIAAAMVALMLYGAQGSVAGSGAGVINLPLASYNISFYVGKALLPINLSPTYEIHSGTADLFTYGPLYFALLFLLAFWLGKGNRLVAYALLFYFFTILPLSGLVRVGYKFYAVLHFMYVALFGLVLALLAGMQGIAIKESVKRLALVACLLITLIFVMISRDYCQIWQNSQVLFAHCLEHDPNNRFARNQMAVVLESKGMLPEAATHFKELIKRYPEFFGGYYGMGRIFMLLEEPAAALKMLDKAMQYNQKRFDIPLDRGTVLLLLQQFAAAETDLTESLQVKESARTRFMRSQARRQQGDYLGAIDDLQRVAGETPDDFSVRISLLELFVESGRGTDALACLLQVLQQIDQNPHDWENFRKVICTPSFSAVVIRMAPYRNLFKYRYKWYPF